MKKNFNVLRQSLPVNKKKLISGEGTLRGKGGANGKKLNLEKQRREKRRRLGVSRLLLQMEKKPLRGRKRGEGF